MNTEPMARAAAAAVTALALGAAIACGGSRKSVGDATDTTEDGDATEFADAPSDAEADETFSCTPGEWGCLDDTHYLCGDDGATMLEVTVCPEACDPELGCVACVPGERTCVGDVSTVCAADGSEWLPGRDCAEWGTTCGPDGFCVDACGEAEAAGAHLGCEFWPVALANTPEVSSSTFHFAVVVTNPGEEEASISVTRAGLAVADEAVPSRRSVEIELPWIEGQSFGIPVNAWSSLKVEDGAYRLTSSVPVSVAQYNPIEYDAGGTFSYSSDGTLLLPSHALGGEYVAVTYTPLSFARGSSSPPTADYFKYPDYVAIVGTSETTTVEIDLAGDVAGETGGAFTSTPAGGHLSVTLERGEVLHLASAVPPDCTDARPGYTRSETCSSGVCDFMDSCAEAGFDLTGSRIVADRPVAVFGGHVCAHVPYDVIACDHLEEQIVPVPAWGSEFVGIPLLDALPTDNFVRIVAARDGTTVAVDPPQGDGFSSASLDAGLWAEFRATGAYSIESDLPVQVAQFLPGQYYTDPDAERGDPAMTLVVPTRQYLAEYALGALAQYGSTTDGQNFVTIAKPDDLEVLIDGTTAGPTWDGAGDWVAGSMPLTQGFHEFTSADPDRGFGIVMSGLGDFTSYATTGGMGLAP